MRVLKVVMALILATLLAGCYFQSDTLLATPLAGGDAILGFGEGGPVRIKFLGEADETTATVVPQKQGDGSVRYEVVSASAAGSQEDKVYLSSIRLSDDRYIVRYTSIKRGTASEVQDTQLAFLSFQNGQYNYLTTIDDKSMLSKIFPAEGQRPKNSPDKDGIFVETLDQAKTISLYFHGHMAEFRKDRDYGRAEIVH